MPAQPRTLTVPQYIAELDRLSGALKSVDAKKANVSGLLNEIPSTWRVQAEPRVFEISAGWLRSDLIRWQDRPARDTLDLIRLRLEDLRADGVAFEAPAPDASEKRASLQRILAANEFHNVHGPTWIDRLKERLVELLVRLLGRALASSVIPTLGGITVYGLMALAVLLLAYWMYRSIRNSGQLETILPHPLPVSSKQWTLWMAEARAAADRGNWRDAIHRAYWCGVSFLEAQGLWRPDYARTPREYLRLLPVSSEHHPALGALTRSFEVVWYGTQEADADAFTETLAQLEKLGCHSA
jgi:hypothetical protein